MTHKITTKEAAFIAELTNCDRFNEGETYEVPVLPELTSSTKAVLGSLVKKGLADTSVEHDGEETLHWVNLTTTGVHVAFRLGLVDEALIEKDIAHYKISDIVGFYNNEADLAGEPNVKKFSAKPKAMERWFAICEKHAAMFELPVEDELDFSDEVNPAAMELAKEIVAGADAGNPANQKPVETKKAKKAASKMELEGKFFMTTGRQSGGAMGLLIDCIAANMGKASYKQLIEYFCDNYTGKCACDEKFARGYVVGAIREDRIVEV